MSPMRRVVFLAPPGWERGPRPRRSRRSSASRISRRATSCAPPSQPGRRSGSRPRGTSDAGRLVPDDLVLRILNERLAGSDARAGFLLDGFPRNLGQAEKLEKIHADRRGPRFRAPGEPPARAALGEDVPARPVSSVYNVATQPPKVPGRCDRDGTELLQRPDDSTEAIAPARGCTPNRPPPSSATTVRPGSAFGRRAPGPPTRSPAAFGAPFAEPASLPGSVGDSDDLARHPPPTVPTEANPFPCTRGRTPRRRDPGERRDRAQFDHARVGDHRGGFPPRGPVRARRARAPPASRRRRPPPRSTDSSA